MTEDVFVKAILASPEDDAPRLIFSDWLDEQGQCERAEFIRVQCRLPAIPIGQYHFGALPFVDPIKYCRCEFCVLRGRERELMLSWNLWHGFGRVRPVIVCENPVGPSDDASLIGGGLRIRFHRGFVHAVTCTAEDWLSHAEAILAAQPVQDVALTTFPHAWQDGSVESMAYWHRPEKKLRVPFGYRLTRLALLEHTWPGIKFTLPLVGAMPLDLAGHVNRVSRRRNGRGQC